MSNDASLLPLWLVPVLFPLMFLTMWSLVTSLLALLAGHPRALAQYPPVDEDLRHSFTFASGRGPGHVRFNGALFVGIGARGLHLAPNGLFRPPWWWGIPCIPWSDIEITAADPKYMLPSVRFTITPLGASWLLYGNAATAIIEQQTQAHHGGPHRGPYQPVG